MATDIHASVAEKAVAAGIMVTPAAVADIERWLENAPPAADLRKAIAQAIYNPGATEGYKGKRSLTDWQTDAVMRALNAAPLAQFPAKA